MATVAKPVRMSTKGQIVIPLELRRQMGIKPGDSLVIVGDQNEATIMTAKRYVESLRGIAGGVYGKTRKEIDAYIKAERRTWQR